MRDRFSYVIGSGWIEKSITGFLRLTLMFEVILHEFKVR